MIDDWATRLFAEPPAEPRPITVFRQPDEVMERARYFHSCPECKGYLRDRGGVWTCDRCGFEPEWEQRTSFWVPLPNDDEEWTIIPTIGTIASMQRLGASVEELARETIESIMGFQGKGGHKPPRPDIQKMKDAYDLFQHSRDKTTPEGLDDSDLDAQKEWADKYGLNEKEISAVSLYKHVLNNRSGDFYNNPQKAFDFVARIWSFPQVLERSQTDPGAMAEMFSEAPIGSAYEYASKELPAATPDGKKLVGTALKKYEQQNYPMLYTAIENALDDVYRRGVESYKLWPRMVTWIKDWYQNWLLHQNHSFNRPNQSWNSISGAITHIEDIVTEGGKILDQLRRENKLPQGFDVNKVSFKDFEDWLMQWKRENLGSEHAGQVVYEFKDGWTIQKLTTPEQLQFEGDEMGHCVGSFANAVASGEDIIYSLRDPKGTPHVTMEIRALAGYKNPRPSPNESQTAYIHPEHDPKDFEVETFEPIDSGNLARGYDYVPANTKPFEVVQVQGNSNKTPKPEYQRKIKEFLDYLRSKGWKFVRSDNWFAPFDDPAQEYGEGSPDSARDLDEWYDNHYKTHHEAYRGVGEGDAYGLPAERATIGIGDWEELFKDCVYSLVNEYDQGKWRGNWKDLAQAVWHAWAIDIYKDHLDARELEQSKKRLLEEIEKTEEVLAGWTYEHVDAIVDHNPEAMLDKFDDLLRENGLLEQFEQRVDEVNIKEYGDSNILPYGADNRTKIQIAESEYEALWQEAQNWLHDYVTDETFGDAYKFCQYLYMLAEKNGMVNPQDLPDPNERHGGLPSYEELQEMPWKHDDFEQNEHPMSQTVEKGLPGALSKVASPWTWPNHPEVLYHGAPKAFRAQIEQQGLVPSKRPDPNYPLGVFLSTGAREAADWGYWKQEKDPDIWAVDVRGLQLENDPNSYNQNGEDDNYYCAARIGPERLTLVDDWRTASVPSEYQIHPSGADGDLPGAFSSWYIVAMAEHSGDPTLDKLIEEFEQTAMIPVYDEEGYDDEKPISEWRNCTVDNGYCHGVSQEFVSFLEEKDIDAEISDYLPIDDPAHVSEPHMLGYGTNWPNHTVAIVRMPTGTYAVDWTAAQFGEKEFPLVQRLDDQGSWRRQWTTRRAGLEDELQTTVWLQNAENMFGNLKPESKERILRFIADPKHANWEECRGIVIQSPLLSLWQAVARLDPRFGYANAASLTPSRELVISTLQSELNLTLPEDWHTATASRGLPRALSGWRLATIQSVANVPADFVGALRTVTQLRQEGIIHDWCLIGSVASFAYMEPSATKDMDVVVLVGSDQEWWQVVQSARRFGPALGWAGAELNGVHVEFSPSFGFPLYEAALQNAVPMTVDGLSVKIPPAEYLVVLALQAWRPKDVSRIQGLLPGSDHAKIQELIAQYDNGGLPDTPKGALKERFAQSLKMAQDMNFTQEGGDEWQSRFYESKREYHEAKKQLPLDEKLREVSEIEQGLASLRGKIASDEVQIYPIDHDHNVWFDTDGNQRQRYRPGWAKNPETGKMEQTGELEDSFLDKHGRQGQGWVAYHGDQPVGSFTYVDDQGWHMIGTAYTHPNYREQGIFNRLVQPLRETGRPIDAYVWEAPWLRDKVRSWR